MIETANLAGLITNSLGSTCHISFGKHDRDVVTVEREMNLPFGNVNVSTNDIACAAIEIK
jgi:hypothetical protein